MEEAADLGNYLPLSYKSPKEQEYIAFLLLNHNPENHEYSDAADQIRDVLIHGNYLSQKNVEICLGFDISTLVPARVHSYQGVV